MKKKFFFFIALFFLTPILSFTSDQALNQKLWSELNFAVQNSKKESVEFNKELEDLLEEKNKESKMANEEMDIISTSLAAPQRDPVNKKSGIQKKSHKNSWKMRIRER